MAFERHQPSVDLRAFLDPLKPGFYFDCGEARLYGIDEALEAEAIRRGRPVGNDEFQLVATDGGLIFCRASITFAIAARWKDLVISRPEEGEPDDKVLLPISWPTHGDLQFTVSRRLGSNVFRRWLQVQAQATRRSQVEQDARFEQTRRSTVDELDHDELEPDRGLEIGTGSNHREPVAGRQGVIKQIDVDGQEATADPKQSGLASPTIRIDDADREAIRLATGRRQPGQARATEPAAAEADRESTRPPSPPPTVTSGPVIDDDALESWVDDRNASFDHGGDPADDPSHGNRSDGYHNHRESIGVTNHPIRFEPPDGGPSASGDEPIIVLDDDGRARVEAGDEAEPEAIEIPSLRRADGDAMATQFMSRTADGTEVFPGQDAGSGYLDGLFDPADRTSADASGASRGAKPVPEIAGARLQRPVPAADRSTSPDPPSLDIRSTLLAGGQEDEWIDTLRRHRLPILAAATVVALILIVLLGLLSGGGDDASVPTAADTIDIPSRETETPRSTAGVVPGEAASEPSARAMPVTSEPDGAESLSTLRVTSTSVQICHSNYGGCVPVAADVDCVGDGDGPAFQTEPVAVFGDDVYDLDTDDDRQACEPGQPPASAGADGGKPDDDDGG
jgi:hypothetical protein